MELSGKGGEKTGQSCDESTSNSSQTGGLSLAKGNGDRGQEEGDGERNWRQPVWNQIQVFLMVK